MGAVVMPGLLTGLAFDVIGLGSVFFWAADQGIGWILFVAGCVSGLPGVVTPVVKPETGVFLIASIGFVWVFIAVGGARYVGAIAFLVGLWGWSQTSRPEILVASGTGLVGVMSDRGRALSKPKGDGFAARVWLENDADIVDQPAGAERWQQLQLPDGIQFFAGSEIEGNCVLGGIVIAPKSENTKLSGDCILTDKHWLKREGATAISTKNGQLRISTARSVTGDRLWAR
jgi:competence protein ComEC